MFLAPPGASSQASLLDLAARLHVSLEEAYVQQTFMSESKGSPQTYSPTELGFDNDLQKLRGALVKEVSAFGDREWADANFLLRLFLMRIYEASGQASRSFASDQRLPAAHAQALLCVGDVLEYAREREPKLYSVLKFIVKKEGVASLTKRIAEERAVPVYAMRLSMVKQCQAIERLFSGLTAVTLTFKVVQSQAERDAFCACLKPLCEHTHVNDKHTAIILACRGFFTPGYGDAPTRSFPDSIHASVWDARFPRLSKCLRKSPYKGSLHTAKSALPLLEVPARYAVVCGGVPFERENREEGSEVGDLLIRLVQTQGGEDGIRALEHAAIEACREYLLRPGSLPPASPFITQSRNAVTTLSAWLALIEGKKKDRMMFRADVATVGRIVLGIARVRGEDGMLLQVIRCS